MEAQHAFVKSTPRVQLPAITISREAGAGVITIGHLAAKYSMTDAPEVQKSLGLFSSVILPRRCSMNTISRLRSSTLCVKTPRSRSATRSTNYSGCILILDIGGTHYSDHSASGHYGECDFVSAI
jgi:hypothetical protein